MTAHDRVLSFASTPKRNNAQLPSVLAVAACDGLRICRGPNRSVPGHGDISSVKSELSECGRLPHTSCDGPRPAGDGPQRVKPHGRAVEIPCDDGRSLPAYFAEVSDASKSRSAVICFGDSSVSRHELLRRLASHSLADGLSLLLIDAPGADAAWSESATLGEVYAAVAGCFEFLTTIGRVDAGRVVLYGYGFAGTRVSEIVTLDRRFAAAICDGGIWHDKMRELSIDAISGNRLKGRGEGAALPTRLARKIACPFLVVADDYDFLQEADLKSLQRFCRMSGIDMSVVPASIKSEAGCESRPATSIKTVFAWIAAIMDRSSISL